MTQVGEPPERARIPFYARIAAAGDVAALAEARALEGLEEEIALLRDRLRGLTQQQPEEMPLLLQGINTLVRAVAVQQRLAGRDHAVLARQVEAIAGQVGRLLVSSNSAPPASAPPTDASELLGATVLGAV